MSNDIQDGDAFNKATIDSIYADTVSEINDLPAAGVDSEGLTRHQLPSLVSPGRYTDGLSQLRRPSAFQEHWNYLFDTDFATTPLSTQLQTFDATGGSIYGAAPSPGVGWRIPSIAPHNATDSARILMTGNRLDNINTRALQVDGWIEYGDITFENVIPPKNSYDHIMLAIGFFDGTATPKIIPASCMPYSIPAFARGPLQVFGEVTQAELDRLGDGQVTGVFLAVGRFLVYHSGGDEYHTIVGDTTMKLRSFGVNLTPTIATDLT